MKRRATIQAWEKFVSERLAEAETLLQKVDAYLTEVADE